MENNTLYEGVTTRKMITSNGKLRQPSSDGSVTDKKQRQRVDQPLQFRH
jgi:hypothetical protein